MYHDFRVTTGNFHHYTGRVVPRCLAKVDKEGNARKVVGCSCVVVAAYGEESKALSVLQESIKAK
jgi:hypothetical protein